MNNDWELIDLRIFCCVARRASFVAAAAELGISTAYVSKRIAGLERALGVRLFHRTTRRVHTSDEGEIAYVWARKVLEAADDMRRQLSRTKEAPAGPLRISTSLRLGRNHVSHILSELERRYPALEIWLELVDRRIDLIGEGFDIDIRVGEVGEPHVVAHRIARSTRILCAAPAYLQRRGHPRTLAELAQHDCLPFRDREQPFGVWRMEGPHGPESVKVTGPMASNHSDPVRNWALDGQGIILLSGWDIADELRDGRIERVLPDYCQPADIWAVTPTRLGDSTKLRICVEFLIEQLRGGRWAVDTSVA